jgi:hypothetical protein
VLLMFLDALQVEYDRLFELLEYWPLVSHITVRTPTMQAKTQNNITRSHKRSSSSGNTIGNL